MDNAVGITLEGANEPTFATPTEIHVFKSILAGWNRWRPEDNATPKFQYYRLKNATEVASSCLIGEIVYEGARVRTGD